jgi:hypothetical protein
MDAKHDRDGGWMLFTEKELSLLIDAVGTLIVEYGEMEGRAELYAKLRAIREAVREGRAYADSDA